MKDSIAANRHLKQFRARDSGNQEPSICAEILLHTLLKNVVVQEIQQASGSDSGGARERSGTHIIRQQSGGAGEQYAVNKAEETTSTVNNCLRIAEDIKGDAARTLETLHQQGEQIHRTHQTAVTIDQDLSKGEKLLGSLGGMFSRTWKPKKTREIKGPQITPEPSSKAATKEQKKKLGTAAEPKEKKSSKAGSMGEPANCYDKIEMEKAKQDDALDDLSNILGDLKGMAVDMGSELEKQNTALDHLGDDVDELNSRVKGANERARKLVNKIALAYSPFLLLFWAAAFSLGLLCCNESLL
ncbi:hypothetical protein V2J09_003669 [Rumex salicifolius]